MLNELQETLNIIKGKLEHLGGIFDTDNKLAEILEIEKAMSAPGFWDSPKKAEDIMSRLKVLKSVTDPFQKYLDETKELHELISIIDADDVQSAKEVKDSIAILATNVDKLEFKSLLNGELDSNNAILSINAGAGGTESCDWASMLLRMYERWASNRGYSVEEVDFLPGEEAGIKNVTIIVKGAWAYGYLKTEKGVHRLVRISPFDSNRRRHTSFASVDVLAEITKEAAVNIEDKDIRIDVYRSSGPGGQSVNTTDSAVRITHLPTGIVVQCQNERSQIKNRATAMKILKARLYEIEQEKIRQQMEKEHSAKQKIEWGSQIRSYVFHPYNMVKDHRTKEETSNTQAVMNGEIDNFIQAYLKMVK
ncbi:MAG: peptide chain release factor 2 [Candidatus Omnitrophota bacterium]